ncbi:MAG TPA: DUF4956 domain-containing protein, partial [Draconibacterium sp.]|nr:DUF4956 domain-containing protein [Draconibacterium sp.]
LSEDYVGYIGLSLVNLLLIGTLGALEKVLLMRQEDSLQVIYENIHNIHKENEVELLKDLESRTGIKIKRYQIDKIDFLRDIARITIYFDINNSKKQSLN